jgi:hypothetical protein
MAFHNLIIEFSCPFRIAFNMEDHKESLLELVIDHFIVMLFQLHQILESLEEDSTMKFLWNNLEKSQISSSMV